MQNLGVGLIILSISLGFTAIGYESAFADEIKIENARGSSMQGCEVTNLCFVPSYTTARVGDTIIFLNGDDAAHTSTSGTPMTGPDGVWDSGLQQPGVDYKLILENTGTFDYFCMVHPWMAGQLQILPAGAEIADTMTSNYGQTVDQTESIIYGTNTPEVSDKDPKAISEVFANIVTNDATKDSPLIVEVEFMEADGFVINHVNYDIKITQNGQVIFADEDAHRHLFKYPVHTTSPLEYDPKDYPVDIDVTFQGIGHFIGSLNEVAILGVHGPVGQTSTFQIVPEFGVVASLVLVISIVAVIGLSAKTRLIQKF
ncbi:MAG: PEFG-CTERM sorting domain-containing protein [Crenarchaeota archaeon]|nr:PEFG-CTERM sorting domain-containing protein [Thermoproteota archaeon]MDA1124691.1 PEFG-CTERM sorting domain-containing protein [Thermoproteota archaeon]